MIVLHTDTIENIIIDSIIKIGHFLMRSKLMLHFSMFLKLQKYKMSLLQI